MRSFSTSSPLALTLAFACFLPAVAPAAVITSSVSGNLLGAQSLSLFNPSLGTLTGVTFQLNSTAFGAKNLTGIFVPATGGFPPFIPPTPAFCTPGIGTVGFTISGYNSNLNTNLTSLLSSTGTPADCVAPAGFSRTINQGPTAGLGALSNYIGLGTMTFNFGISSATTSAWTGTLAVNYTYLTSETETVTPEPSTWAMVGTALVAVVWRRRRV